MKTRPGECEGFQESGKNILAKGQLISKGLFWPFGPKNQTDFKGFLPWVLRRGRIIKIKALYYVTN